MGDDADTDQDLSGRADARRDIVICRAADVQFSNTGLSAILSPRLHRLRRPHDSGCSAHYYQLMDTDLSNLRHIEAPGHAQIDFIGWDAAPIIWKGQATSPITRLRHAPCHGSFSFVG